MGLERLAPLGDEGGKPTPSASRRGPHPKPERTPSETKQPWGSRGEGFATKARAPKKPAERTKKSWPTREEREARAEAKAEARAAEIAADPTGYARQVCLMLLEIQPRSRKELETALAKKGVPEEAAEEVLGRFTEVGLIDDAQFASLWVASRHRGRGLAGRALSHELRRKGIDDELIVEAVAELEPEQEEATARLLVQKKLRTTRALTTEQRVRRLVGMLARKGYSGGVAFRIVKEELDREGADTEALSLDTDGLSGVE
jgi:regulatory protein